MSTKTAAKTLGDVLAWEQNSRYSREIKTIIASQTVLIGTVLKRAVNGDISVLSANQNAVQTLSFAGTPSAGEFFLSGLDKDGARRTTGPIAFSGTAATLVTNINTALDDAFGSGAIVASGTNINAIALTFSGTGYAGTAHELMEIEISTSFTGDDDISITHTTLGGGNDPDFETNDYAIIGVSLAEVTTGAAETAKIPVLVRDGIVKKNGLGYGTATFALVESALNKLGIIVREDI
jgi:hypothetical protein